MNQLTTKDAEATFLALQKSSMELAEKCSKIQITSDTELQLAKQNYSMLNSTIGQIEVVRVQEKKPYKEAGEQIDALAKKLSLPLKTVFEAGKLKILAYEKTKQEIAQKEQNRINAIKSAISKYSADAIKVISECKTMEELTTARERGVKDFIPPVEWLEFEADWKAVKVALNDLCIAKRIEIQTPAQADETMAETIKEHIEAKVEEVAVVENKAAEYSSTTKIKGTWRFELVNLAEVPREYLMLDEKKVKEFIKNNSESLVNGDVQGGIKFFIEDSVSIR
jgi:hypothetical protein